MMGRVLKQIRLSVITLLLVMGASISMFAMPSMASSGFQYNHDPRLNCKAMQDIVVNPDAIYGFSPSTTGSLKEYASYDWTDPTVVEKARQSRIQYHEQCNGMYDTWEKMKNQGATDQEIAKVVCDMRNQIRLDAYKDDPEGLAKVKARNLEKYGDENGPSAEYIYTHYNYTSWLEVIYSAFKTNSGMDACLGLYDDQYNHNLLTGSIKEHTLNQGVVTKAATATEAGILTRTCSVCGTQLTEAIPATGEKELSPSASEKASIALSSDFKVSLSKSKLNVKWGKADNAASYEIYAAYVGSKMVKVKTVKATSKASCTITKIGKKKINLKKKIKVYVVALDQQNKVIGKSIVGYVVGSKNKTYSNAKKLTLSQASYSLTVGQTANITCKMALSNGHKKAYTSKYVKKYRYATSNQYVATVSDQGVIKGVKAGSCDIYVYAPNGLSKKISVTVK